MKFSEYTKIVGKCEKDKKHIPVPTSMFDEWQEIFDTYEKVAILAHNQLNIAISDKLPNHEKCNNWMNLLDNSTRKKATILAQFEQIKDRANMYNKQLEMSKKDIKKS